MLVDELFEGTNLSLMGTNKQFLKIGKKANSVNKTAFPTPGNWHFVQAKGKKQAGWSKVDHDVSGVDEISHTKSTPQSTKIKPTYTRDTAPTGANQKYRTFVKKASQGIPK